MISQNRTVLRSILTRLFGPSGSFCILVLGFIVSYYFVIFVTKGEPSKASSGLECNFGRVKQGDSISYDFTLRNPTANLRKITATKATCGCSVMEGVPDALPPNGVGTVRAKLNTTGKLGRVNESIFVQLDETQWVVLNFVGIVESDRLAYLDFGNVKRGQDISKYFSLADMKSGDEIEVKNLLYDKQFLTVYEKQLQESQELSYSVRLRDDVPYGVFSKEIAVHTTDETNPVIKLFATGNVLYPIVSDPDELVIDSLHVKETKCASVRLLSPYNYPVAVDHIEDAGGDPIEWRITPEANGAQRIDVAMTRRDPARKFLKSVLTVWAKAGTETLPLKVEVYGLAAQ